MKLRLRNLSTNETLKIQVPDPCSLPQLKLIVSDAASLSQSSPLHLSLNRKDELRGSNSDEDTIRSLGVTSGDLIFFSLDSNSFSSKTLISQFRSGGRSSIGVGGDDNAQEIVIGKPESSDSGTRRGKTIGPVSQNEQETLIGEPESGDSESGRESQEEEKTLIVEPGSMSSELGIFKNEQKTLVVGPDSESKIPGNYELGKDKTLVTDSQMEETLNSETSSGNENLFLNTASDLDETLEMNSKMEIDGADDVVDVDTGKGFSVPSFLRKVFNKELGDSGGCDHKLVVIAVHAVLSESGFVGFDTVSKMKINCFYLPDVWGTLGFTLSLCYTLPEIVQSSGVVQTVQLKVQSLGKYVNFYGALAGKGSGTYRVCLDRERLAIVLNLMWANLDTAIESGSIIHPDKEVFEFWKTVKDKLALPLLIDLCEAANLPPPSCFTCLPTEMKQIILELLPGVDLAKAACVSTELQFLSSYDDLWKKKFFEQFGNVEMTEGSNAGSSWKRKFVKEWETRKQRRVRRVTRGPAVWVPRGYRDPSAFRFPGIIGGDYDLGPNIPMGGWLFRRHAERNVMPRCNFGDRRA